MVYIDLYIYMTLYGFGICILCVCIISKRDFSLEYETQLNGCVHQTFLISIVNTVDSIHTINQNHSTFQYPFFFFFFFLH